MANQIQIDAFGDGFVPGVPGIYGGMSLVASDLDPNTLLLYSIYGFGHPYLMQQSIPNVYTDLLLAGGTPVPNTAGTTLLVAANNALSSTKGRADYIALGSSDQVTVQSAITALGSTGGTIILSEGLFSINADITTNSVNNIRIIGSGPATILQLAAGCQANAIKITGSSHITISDLQIDGNKANVAQIGIQYISLSGIQVVNSDDVHITNCYIHDCYVSGVMANGNNTNLRIVNNRLVNCFDNQIYVRAKNLSAYTPCSYGVIVGNVCSGGSYSGIQVLGSSYFAIAGNTCYSNGPTSGQGDGIGSEGASYITITGNTCYNNGVQGINVRFTNEVGTNQASSHITVSGNTIYNHTSTGGDAGGIGISDSNHVTVTGNTLYNNNFGINVANVASMGVNDLKITGNSIKTCTDTGIRLNPASGVTFEISDNYVADTTNNGIHLYSKAWVHNNTIARSGGNGGIECNTGSGGSVLEENHCYDGANNGIQIDNGVANVVCKGNYHANVALTTQGRGIQEASGGGPTIIRSEVFSNITFQPFNLTNASSSPRNSGLINGSASGFLDQNSGSASISAATSITVSHGLWTTPTRVEITPTGDPGSGIRYWISAKTSTTFTITLSASSTVAFDWRAWTWDS